MHIMNIIMHIMSIIMFIIMHNNNHIIMPIICPDIMFIKYAQYEHNMYVICLMFILL